MKPSAVVAVIALALTACGGGSDGAEVSSAWARTSAPGQTSGAVYFDLTVGADDRLVGASVPIDVATRAEIHEVISDEPAGETDDMDDMDMSEGSHDMDDMDMDGDMEGMDGMQRMQEMPDGLALTADETVSFAPGGYHVMLPELTEPLVAGAEFELTLDFANADDVTVTVEVADAAP